MLCRSYFVLCSLFLEQHSHDSEYCLILLLLEVDMWPEVPKNVGYIFYPKCNNKYTRNNYKVERIWAKIINRFICIILMLRATWGGYVKNKCNHMICTRIYYWLILNNGDGVCYWSQDIPKLIRISLHQQCHYFPFIC